MFEAESEVGALPGGILDDGRDAAGLFECEVDRFGDAVEALLFGDLFQVAPGVEVQTVEPEEFAAFHFVDEGLARLFQPFRIGMSEVDQVGVVGQDLCGGVAAFVAGAAEGVDFGGRQGFGHPLSLVLGEEGESVGPDGAGIPGCVVDPARCADMCSEVFHGVRCFVLFRTKLRNL